MKTILYQPIFINPQAYFVFPQLYHIEKGDSYIEPANITGQLIINDLTKSLTSTPILNVVQDTNQVDFGLFKGKHIRISQYTNIGAVVLGERYIPGTPTPPEPENLEITDEFPNGVIRDSLGGEYYLLPHSSDYTIENGLMKSTDDTFLISIENANENDVKAMIIDMYYDSTVPGSYLNGEYTEGSVKLTNRRIMGINNPTTTSIFQDLMQVLETGFTIGKIALYNYDNNSRKGDFTYPKDKEECVAYAMSSSPDRLTWGNYETTEPLKFTDYITIHKGSIMNIEIYYKSDNIGCINSYILFFKKDKTTGQIYKTHILVTKELLRSANGFNNLLVEIPYVGCIGSKQEEFNDELLYKPDIRVKGTFAQKPVSSQSIYQGFSYFCTDKQTTEGSRNGIMIYYVGDDTWTDALGRYIH